MNSSTRSILSLALVIGILLGTGYLLSAQQRPERRQMDPEQMLERMVARATEDLDASEEELQVLEPRIEAILRQRFTFMQDQGMRDLIQALRNAVESSDESAIRTKLDELKAKRKEHETRLDQLEKELLELLTLKQEAQLTLAGVVNGGVGAGMGMRGGFGGPPGDRSFPRRNRGQ